MLEICAVADFTITYMEILWQFMINYLHKIGEIIYEKAICLIKRYYIGGLYGWL